MNNEELLKKLKDLLEREQNRPVVDDGVINGILLAIQEIE